MSELPLTYRGSVHHRHRKQDELVDVLQGKLTLIADSGEEIVSWRMSTKFTARVEKDSHLVNRGTLDNR